MLSPDDIRAMGIRRYPSYLRALVMAEAFFPLKIPFGRPSTSDEWPRLQKEITALATGTVGYRIEWTTVNTRRWGEQRMPERVWFDDEATYLQALGKKAEVNTLRGLLALTHDVCPELKDWLPDNVLRVVEFASVWRELLFVCRYFLVNPRPGVYARELPIAVDTKFVERHEGILRNLLDFLLPDSAKTDAPRFEQRFGLKYEEPQIRFRVLGEAMPIAASLPFTDVAVPLSQFASLGWSDLTIVIVENKRTFLSLPSLAGAVGIWGGGGAAQLLVGAPWLAACRLFYWGDLDVHGFHILSQLRRAFPELASVMMDTTTLERFEAQCGSGKPATYEEVRLLNAEELVVYQRVRSNGLLLEQEKVTHDYAVERLRAICVRCGRSPTR
jgi:hypothetical protein